jgi:hypothetical protein
MIYAFVILIPHLELAPDFIVQQRVFTRMLLSSNIKSFAGQPITCRSWLELLKVRFIFICFICIIIFRIMAKFSPQI